MCTQTNTYYIVGCPACTDDKHVPYYKYHRINMSLYMWAYCIRHNIIMTYTDGVRNICYFTC